MHPQVHDVDPVDGESPEVVLDGGPQLGRHLGRQPLSAPVAPGPHLAHQGQLCRVGVQCLADELVGDDGSVELGGVDVVDPQLDSSAQHGNGLVMVAGWAEDTGTGQLHGTETHPTHHLWAKKERVATGHFGRLPGRS